MGLSEVMRVLVRCPAADWSADLIQYDCPALRVMVIGVPAAMPPVSGFDGIIVTVVLFSVATISMLLRGSEGGPSTNRFCIGTVKSVPKALRPLRV